MDFVAEDGRIEAVGARFNVLVGEKRYFRSSASFRVSWSGGVGQQGSRLVVDWEWTGLTGVRGSELEDNRGKAPAGERFALGFIG